jgi:hypothetical protein
MPLGVPAVSRSDQAALLLAQSRALWQVWRTQPVDFRLSGVPRTRDGQLYRGRAYSYVRARQISDARVELTLFVVGSASEREPEREPERVLTRALVSADPNHLDSHAGAKQEQLRSEWVERSTAIGAHAAGAPARTVDELYDDCARLLAAHRELEPHLYFHPNGVLMHCGFTVEQCRNCPEISIESFSHYSFDWEWPHADPAKWVCGTRWGVFAPGTELPELSSAIQCAASYLPLLPRPRTPPPAEGAGLQDICEIDPIACPPAHTDGAAFWGQILTPCPQWPARAPNPLEIGKPAPRTTWSFPFSNGADGIECGDKLGEVQHRVSPTLTPKPERAPEPAPAPAPDEP